MTDTIALEPCAAGNAKKRLVSIDALRGLVMILMLVDHVRETWFLHMQISDPVNAVTVDPALFFTRLISAFCAPVFVALTGLSAWLYGQARGREETSRFLLKRGFFLMFLEVTFVCFAWSARFPPQTIWLQVIWAIGVSMIALSGLLHLPRRWQFMAVIVIVCGHNLLDGIVLVPASNWYALWALLHQRAIIDLGGGMAAKTTYPVLPWIGVILLGYLMGPWFARGSDAAQRIKRLALLSAAMVGTFVVLRGINIYGDKPWFHAGSELRTVMSFLSLTKYPPSLLFLLPTLGFGVLMLALFERLEARPVTARLALLGGAPMFFYLLHLYLLKSLYLIALAMYGPTKGTVFGVDNVSTLWGWVAILFLPLYFPTRWFAGFKQRHKDIRWLRYL